MNKRVNSRKTLQRRELNGIYLTVTSQLIDENNTNQSKQPTTTIQPPDRSLRRGHGPWAMKVILEWVTYHDTHIINPLIVQVTVTLYASVLQRRNTLVLQPIEIQDDTNSNSNDETKHKNEWTNKDINCQSKQPTTTTQPPTNITVTRDVFLTYYI
jgi:hypothetical protein